MPACFHFVSAGCSLIKKSQLNMEGIFGALMGGCVVFSGVHTGLALKIHFVCNTSFYRPRILYHLALVTVFAAVGAWALSFYARNLLSILFASFVTSAWLTFISVGVKRVIPTQHDPPIVRAGRPLRLPAQPALPMAQSLRRGLT